MTSPHLVRLTRLWLKLRYQIFSNRYNRLVLEEVEGMPLLILPQVFNPVLLRTGRFMVQHFPHLAHLRGAKGLDLGTGSGIGAIFAARQGAHMIAVDINPHAARCARLNVILNHLESHVQVYQGDLFMAIPQQRFDLILFNPPFYRGQAQNALDHAWRGETVFERFAHHLPQLLTPTGQVWLVLSSDGDGAILLNLLREQGLTIEIAYQKDYLNEIITLYKITL